MCSFLPLHVTCSSTNLHMSEASNNNTHILQTATQADTYIHTYTTCVHTTKPTTTCGHHGRQCDPTPAWIDTRAHLSPLHNTYLLVLDVKPATHCSSTGRHHRRTAQNTLITDRSSTNNVALHFDWNSIKYDVLCTSVHPAYSALITHPFLLPAFPPSPPRKSNREKKLPTCRTHRCSSSRFSSTQPFHFFYGIVAHHRVQLRL